MAKKATKSAPKRITKKVTKHYGLVVLAVCVAVCATLVLSWMITREVYLAETKSVRENAENIVINDVGASSALVSVMLAEESGCVKHMDRKNVTYIIQANDKFALAQYGCALDAKTFYKNTDDGWKNISPTNKFINGQPLCSHLKENSIPSSFVSLCYDEPREEGQLPAILENPVK